MCFPCNNNDDDDDDDDDDLEVAHPQSGSSSTRFLIELDMEMLVFEERGKPEYPEKNLSEQGREPTTNSTHIWRRYRDLNPGHIGGRRALSPMRHPLLPTFPFSYHTLRMCSWAELGFHFHRLHIMNPSIKTLSVEGVACSGLWLSEETNCSIIHSNCFRFKNMVTSTM